ncbi:hypothetical protein D3C86_1844240 [compost metagenome]
MIMVVTSRLNAGRLVLSTPSLALITIPVVVPTLALVGVPVKAPVVVLKLAQDGLLMMLNVNGSSSKSLATGVKL